ncbi:MAG: hypothetical protein AB8B55_13680 [Mariniblastus sp.]
MSENGFGSLVDIEDEENFVDPEMLLQQVIENPNLVQQTTRTDNNGLETVAGYFRVSFLPDQQRQVLHVPFTPPFKTMPTIQTHSIEQEQVRVRVTDCQKFGVRVEVILPQATTEFQKLLVEVLASEES